MVSRRLLLYYLPYPFSFLHHHEHHYLCFCLPLFRRCLPRHLWLHCQGVCLQLSLYYPLPFCHYPLLSSQHRPQEFLFVPHLLLPSKAVLMFRGLREAALATIVRSSAGVDKNEILPE